MQTARKIFCFLACAALGYVAALSLAPLAARLHALPNVITDADTHMAQHWIFLGSFVAYLIGLLAGTGYFFAKSRLRYGLLLAPVYLPLLYGMIIIARLDALFGLTPAART